MASSNTNSNTTTNPSSSSHTAPSGRSPFPASRSRTRLSHRMSLEGGTDPPQQQQQHSPFLQGLLRFSPNNAQQQQQQQQPQKHWSPRPSARKPATAFFKETTTEQGNNRSTTNHSYAATPLENTYTNINSNNTVTDGIPLDQLRCLAQQSLLSCPTRATFFASLVHSKTHQAPDALLLAHAHLQAGQYNACLQILEESSAFGTLNNNNDTTTTNNVSWQALLLACAALGAQEEWSSVVELLEDACRLPPTARNTTTTNPPLDDADEFGWHVLKEALTNNTTNSTTEIHLLARLLCWRARAYHETGHGLRAALYWKRALEMDPLCQDAYEHLWSKRLVTPAEAYELVTQSLDFQLPQQEWLKALYLARIELVPATSSVENSSNTNDTTTTDSENHPFKEETGRDTSTDIGVWKVPSQGFSTPGEDTQTKLNLTTNNSAAMHHTVDQAFQQLWTKHKLQNSPHVLAMAARRAFSKYQWKQTIAYTEQLAQLDPNLTGAAFCYLSALVLLGHKQVLFRLGHEWVEANPQSAQAWFAVGCYYYACQRYHVAQRHFCRATRLDPQCTPAWIAFGCAFAACDESDQALASFRAAQRLSPGEHTSLLYMGMEYVRTNHLQLAQHFLQAAWNTSGGDPLCWHELGVWALQTGDLHQAQECLTRALQIEKDDDYDDDDAAYWEPTWFTLGHVYRKLRELTKAEECYQECVALCPEKASCWNALALVQHMQHKLDPAIEAYHTALGLKPDDAFGAEMLHRALREQSVSGWGEENTENELKGGDDRVKINVDESANMSLNESAIPRTPGSMMSSMDVDMSADSRGTPYE